MDKVIHDIVQAYILLLKEVIHYPFLKFLHICCQTNILLLSLMKIIIIVPKLVRQDNFFSLDFFIFFFYI